MRLSLISLPALSVLMTGCASITQSDSQSVFVQTVCEGRLMPGAACRMQNDKGEWRLVSPSIAGVRKSYGDLQVDCQLGTAIGQNIYQSKNTTAVWGNILAGGVIGYAVDSGSGKGFNYPESVTIVLNPPCDPSEEKKP